MNYNVHNVRALSDDIQDPKHGESDKVADGLHRMRKILEEEKQQHKVPFYNVDPAQIEAAPHSKGNIPISKARYTHLVEK
jgi:alkanesulfonate monooxygenase SsuD/methylene tetrahydromethanopterin reductase-like flavin-dependent oxidoreductase (luciferase family)